MITNLYAVYDSKLDAYNNPFTYPTDAAALRAFLHAGSDESTAMGAHPADFTLFRIGAFDLETGLIKSKNMPKSLGNLLNLLIPENATS